jgi:hypothetical protein
MKLTDCATGENHEAVIELITAKDLKQIKKKDRFIFDWSKYKSQELYKIRLKANEIILGLMCVIEHLDAATNAIEIELLEASVENTGPDKKWDKIGGCLIAFACRESFKRGHEGCVFLTPKSYLLKHYPKKYGFAYIPIKSAVRPEGIMIAYDDIARKLIKQYLD